jgi:hypothetical protein
MFAQAYTHGIALKDKNGKSTPQMPEPYWFFWGSAAMGVAGLVAMANARLGLVMAWGFMLGAMVYKYQDSKTKAAQTTAQTTATAKLVAGLPTTGVPTP